MSENLELNQDEIDNMEIENAEFTLNEENADTTPGIPVKEVGIDVKTDPASSVPALTAQFEMSVEDLKAEIAKQDLILEVMVDYLEHKLVPKKDYYSVKADADKPSLTLSGASKIAFLFKLKGKMIIEDKSYTPNEITATIRCDLYHLPTGAYYGSGAGWCSSSETKYSKAKAVDMGNTVVKMAGKRAYVDAIIKNTMASYLFTQDLEDLPDYYIGKDAAGKLNPGKRDSNTTAPDVPETKLESAQKFWKAFNWDLITDYDDKPEILEFNNKKTGKTNKYTKEGNHLFNLALGRFKAAPEVNKWYNETVGKSWQTQFTYDDLRIMVEKLL